jgi:hypothetical protein
MKIFLVLFYLLILGCNSKDNEWKNLIINNSLEGWHIFQDDGTKGGWYIENQVMVFDAISDLESGNGDASLLSNKEYTSFEIEFKWKIEKGGNSGFMWGFNENSLYKYPYQTGPEIQIIDPSVYKKPEEVLGGKIELNNVISDLQEKKHYLGAVYDLFPPINEFDIKPIGNWNHYLIKIDQKNNQGSLKLNGILINEFPLRGELWESSLSKSKFNNSEEYEYLGEKRWYDFAKFPRGSICLQDHPGKAYFRKILIRELY